MAKAMSLPIIASLEKHGSSADYSWNDFLTADQNDGDALDAPKSRQL